MTKASKDAAMASTMQYKGRRSPKEVVSVEIRHADNGGHVVEHRMKQDVNGGRYREPETHVFGKGEGQKVLAHVAKHMGIAAPKATDDEGDD